jgi:hypothetical protein
MVAGGDGLRWVLACRDSRAWWLARRSEGIRVASGRGRFVRRRLRLRVVHDLRSPGRINMCGTLSIASPEATVTHAPPPVQPEDATLVDARRGRVLGRDGVATQA